LSNDNPLERDLGRPLRRPTERELGRPLPRPALPPAASELDDEPMPVRARARFHAGEHWPDEEPTAPAEVFVVEEGPIVEALEWYFPLIWAACVIIISYIGIYHAVGKLPGANPLPPAWF